ncbi:hypothetical protein [Pseudoneobacillus sp. C159]
MKKYWFSLIICFLLAPSLMVSAFGNSSVYVEMEYVIIRPGDDGKTAVMHMTTVKNLLEEDYIGEKNSNKVLTVHIPKGATSLQVHDNSLGMAETDFGFTTTKAIPAKESIVIPYSYWLDKQQKEIELKYSYPVQGLQLLVPENSGSLNIEGLDYTIEGLFEFEGQNYYGYNLSGIDANELVKVVYDSSKQPSPDEIQPSVDNEATNEGTGTTNSAVGNITHQAPVFHNPGHIRMWYQSPLSGFEPHVLMGVLVAILIGGISYYSYFRWKNKLAEDQRLSDKEEQAFLQLIAKRKAIMDKIVELEENYSGGQVSDHDYQTKLEAYKYHLLQVKLNLQKYTE